jgi:excisionase family DNA binding protein
MMENIELVQIDTQPHVSEALPGCSIIYAPSGQARFSNRSWTFHAEQQGMSMRNLCSRVPVITDDDLACDVVESGQAAWTVEGLAMLLKTSTNFIYQQIRRGLLPAYRVGSMLRLDPKATANWLRSRMMGSVQTGVQHG